MAVDQAVAESAAALLAKNGLAEVGQQVEEVRLVDVLGGPHGQARDPALFGQPDTIGALRARPAGEDLGRNAAAAELFADGTDVDIHPAVLARPQGSDRRRVQTDDGQGFQRRASLQIRSTNTSWSPFGHRAVNFELVRDRQQSCVERLTAVGEGVPYCGYQILSHPDENPNYRRSPVGFRWCRSPSASSFFSRTPAPAIAPPPRPWPRLSGDATPTSSRSTARTRWRTGGSSPVA